MLHKKMAHFCRTIPVTGAGAAALFLGVTVCMLSAVIAAGANSPGLSHGANVGPAEKVAKPVSDDSVRSQPEAAENFQTVKMRVTAYCPCEKCCGRYADGVTACGHKIQPGDYFVAADRRFAFGAEMIIPGYNSDKAVEVLDRGGAIRGNRLDVFFHSHQEALNWGVKYLDVKVRQTVHGK